MYKGQTAVLWSRVIVPWLTDYITPLHPIPRPVERLLWAVVNVAWVFPIFFLAKVINATYFQEVADAAYRFLRGSSSTTQTVAHQRE